MKYNVFVLFISLLSASIGLADNGFVVDFEEENYGVPSVEQLCPPSKLASYNNVVNGASATNDRRSLFSNEFKSIWCGFHGILFSSNKNDLSFKERYGGFEKILEEMLQAYEAGLTESNSEMKSKYWTLGNYTVRAKSLNYFEDMRFNRPALQHHIDLFLSGVENMIKLWEWETLVDSKGVEILRPLETDYSIRQLTNIKNILDAILYMNVGRTQTAEIKLEPTLVEDLNNLKKLAMNIIGNGVTDTNLADQSNYEFFLRAFKNTEPRINSALRAIEEYVETRSSQEETASTERTEVSEEPETNNANYDDLLGALDTFNDDTPKVSTNTEARNSKTYRYLTNLVTAVYALGRTKQMYINESN